MASSLSSRPEASRREVSSIDREVRVKEEFTRETKRRRMAGKSLQVEDLSDVTVARRGPALHPMTAYLRTLHTPALTLALVAIAGQGSLGCEAGSGGVAARVERTLATSYPAHAARILGATTAFERRGEGGFARAAFAPAARRGALDRDRDRDRDLVPISRDAATGRSRSAPEG